MTYRWLGRSLALPKNESNSESNNELKYGLGAEQFEENSEDDGYRD